MKPKSSNPNSNPTRRPFTLAIAKDCPARQRLTGCQINLSGNDTCQRVLILPGIREHMSEEENFRRLGLGIIMFEEKLEELKTYAQEMVRDKSKFDADVLINISNRLVSAAYELNQSYENYKSVRSTH